MSRIEGRSVEDYEAGEVRTRSSIEQRNKPANRDQRIFIDGKRALVVEICHVTGHVSVKKQSPCFCKKRKEKARSTLSSETLVSAELVSDLQSKEAI
jgi:hypothetical protein